MAPMMAANLDSCLVAQMVDYLAWHLAPMSVITKARKMAEDWENGWAQMTVSTKE